MQYIHIGHIFCHSDDFLPKKVIKRLDFLEKIMFFFDTLDVLMCN